MTDTGERIAKRIARAGLGSRRDAERMIAAGRVCVDGVPIASPALNVTRAMRVSVDGAPLPEGVGRKRSPEERLDLPEGVNPAPPP